jgi:hypothetical protein
LKRATPASCLQHLRITDHMAATQQLAQRLTRSGPLSVEQHEQEEQLCCKAGPGPVPALEPLAARAPLLPLPGPGASCVALEPHAAAFVDIAA